MNSATRDPQIWMKARNALPLPWLMSKLNDGEFSRKGARCPFCGAIGGKWAVFSRNNRYYFKCRVPDCIANEPEHGNSEIGYIALRRELSAKEACKEYLKLAVPDLVPELFEPPSRGFSVEESSERRREPAEDRSSDAKDRPVKNAWHDLWQRLGLNAEDMFSIIKRRGFSRKTVETLGFRSSIPANLAALEALTDNWDIAELVAEGIYKPSENRAAPTPNGQFAGWGNTGKRILIGISHLIRDS